MKYISLVIGLAFMIWTWSLATSPRSFTLEQHKKVEAGVEDDIRSFILRKYPQTKDIYCRQLFTEVVTPGSELIARFRCQAKDESVEQIFEGFLRLKSSDGFKTWSETGGEIRAPEITFTNGMTITPEKTSDSTPGEGDQATEDHKTEAPQPHSETNSEKPPGHSTEEHQ